MNTEDDPVNLLREKATILLMGLLLAAVTAAVMGLHCALVLGRFVQRCAERLLSRAGVRERTLDAS